VTVPFRSRLNYIWQRAVERRECLYTLCLEKETAETTGVDFTLGKAVMTPARQTRWLEAKPVTFDKEYLYEVKECLHSSVFGFKAVPHIWIDPGTGAFLSNKFTGAEVEREIARMEEKWVSDGFLPSRYQPFSAFAKTKAFAVKPRVKGY
jgi:hypothetical protein